jgi:hypothetical protein
MYGTVATAKSMPAAGVGTAALAAGSHDWSLGLTALIALLALWTLLSAARTATRLIPRREV